MLRALLYFFAAAVWTVILFWPSCLAMLVCWDTGASIWWARNIWSPPLMWIGGVEIEVIGRENVDPKRPTIYVSNHASSLDIPVLFMAIPANVKYVAKKQLGWIPIVGWYLWMAKFILIDRGNRTKAIRTLDKAGERIRSGTSIIVYAEGTRSEDGSIRPFKKGPFGLALKARVPIVPVTIVGSDRIMPRNSWRVHGGLVRVKLGKPIDVSAYAAEERERLMRDVRKIVIQQSLELGGKGGVPDEEPQAPAARGLPESGEAARRLAL